MKYLLDEEQNKVHVIKAFHKNGTSCEYLTSGVDRIDCMRAAYQVHRDLGGSKNAVIVIVRSY